VTPPRNLLLAYRLLGIRLPDEYRPWVAADVRTRSFLWWRIARTALWLFVAFAVLFTALRLGAAHSPLRRTHLIFIGAGILVYALLGSRKVLMRKMLQWHRIDADGMPVEPEKTGRLTQWEAAGLVVVMLVAVAGVSYVYGYGLRPTGVRAAKCRTAPPELVQQLEFGLRGNDPHIVTTSQITNGETTAVVGVVKITGLDQEKLGIWIVRNGAIYSVQGTTNLAKTTFPAPPQNAVDRATGDAFVRASDCLRKLAPR
jgi:hypothetical protein